LSERLHLSTCGGSAAQPAGLDSCPGCTPQQGCVMGCGAYWVSSSLWPHRWTVAQLLGCRVAQLLTAVRVEHSRDSCMYTKVIVVLTVDASSCALLLFVSAGTGNRQGPSGRPGRPPQQPRRQQLGKHSTRAPWRPSWLAAGNSCCCTVLQLLSYSHVRL
jgi:hypothetical protein